MSVGSSGRSIDRVRARRRHHLVSRALLSGVMGAAVLSLAAVWLIPILLGSAPVAVRVAGARMSVTTGFGVVAALAFLVQVGQTIHRRGSAAIAAALAEVEVAAVVEPLVARPAGPDAAAARAVAVVTPAAGDR